MRNSRRVGSYGGSSIFGFGGNSSGIFESSDESHKLRFCDFPQPFQVGQLGFDVIIRTVEPIPFPRRAMHSEWSTNGIAKFSGTELILTRENLDSFR